MLKFIMLFPGAILKWLASWIVMAFLMALSVFVSWSTVLILEAMTPTISFVGFFAGIAFFIFIMMHDGVPSEDDIEGLGPG